MHERSLSLQDFQEGVLVQNGGLNRVFGTLSHPLEENFLATAPFHLLYRCSDLLIALCLSLFQLLRKRAFNKALGVRCKVKRIVVLFQEAKQPLLVL